MDGMSGHFWHLSASPSLDYPLSICGSLMTLNVLFWESDNNDQLSWSTHDIRNVYVEWLYFSFLSSYITL